MSRGDERLVVEAFATWLTGQGWTARFEVDWCDFLVERDGQRLYVEAKGGPPLPDWMWTRRSGR